MLNIKSEKLLLYTYSGQADTFVSDSRGWF